MVDLKEMGAEALTEAEALMKLAVDAQRKYSAARGLLGKVDKLVKSNFIEQLDEKEESYRDSFKAKKHKSQ